MENSNLPSQKATQATAVSTSVNFFDPVQFDTAQRMSKLFAASMLVPDTYQTEKIATDLISKKHLDPQQAQQQASMTAVANCMIALDIATRIGASPLMVMQNLVIIYGRPSWSSKFLISTVNTCGRFEPLKFRFTEKGKEWVNTSNGKGFYRTNPVTKEFDGSKIQDIECVAYTTAKGSKDVLESSPISLRMAVDEGWYTKPGSKWRTMPKQMLMYRAASFWTSVYAPELSMGMRTIEETQDVVDITDTAEELQEEMARKANRETIGFGEDASADTKHDEQAADNVDPKTGEIHEAGDAAPVNAQEGKSEGTLFTNEDGPGY